MFFGRPPCVDPPVDMTDPPPETKPPDGRSVGQQVSKEVSRQGLGIMLGGGGGIQRSFSLKVRQGAFSSLVREYMFDKGDMGEGGWDPEGVW